MKSTERPDRQIASDGLDTLHHRRTLDQFYYSGLEDTRARDAGQTVSKWTGTSTIDKNGRREAVDDSLVVMVDQLWVWVLDDGKTGTVHTYCSMWLYNYYWASSQPWLSFVCRLVLQPGVPLPLDLANMQ